MGESWLTSRRMRLRPPWFHPGTHFQDLLLIVSEGRQERTIVPAAGGWGSWQQLLLAPYFRRTVVASVGPPLAGFLSVLGWTDMYFLLSCRDFAGGLKARTM